MGKGKARRRRIANVLKASQRSAKNVALVADSPPKDKKGVAVKSGDPFPSSLRKLLRLKAAASSSLEPKLRKEPEIIDNGRRIEKSTQPTERQRDLHNEGNTGKQSALRKKALKQRKKEFLLAKKKLKKKHRPSAGKPDRQFHHVPPSLVMLPLIFKVSDTCRGHGRCIAGQNCCITASLWGAS